MNYLSKPWCKKDEGYIPEELWNLWQDIFGKGKIGAYHMNAYAIYHYISNEAYYNQGGPPPPINDDILCIIDYGGNCAGYSIRERDFDSLKEYISALKNIAFL